MDRKLDINKVYDLSHRLWYQVTTGLTDANGRGAPSPSGPTEADVLDGAISALKEILPLLEKHREGL